jgi:hypothetical protein
MVQLQACVVFLAEAEVATDASRTVSKGAQALSAALLCVGCLFAESATRTGFGKGFKPQVAPLSSLLGKLQARQAALGAK